MALVASHFGVDLADDWRGVDALLPVLERMRCDGAVVLLKLAGGRGPGGKRPYTVLVSGGGLAAEAALRVDARTIEEGLSRIVVHYAMRCWKEELSG